MQFEKDVLCDIFRVPVVAQKVPGDGKDHRLFRAQDGGKRDPVAGLCLFQQEVQVGLWRRRQAVSGGLHL